jgi:hypothetical protein
MCRVTRHAMARWLGFVIGLLTFSAAHVIEVAKWALWFGGAHAPWFLNSGRAIVFTLGCVFAVSFIAGVLQLPGAAIAAGAATAMTLILLLGGSGTIMPIVLAAGGLMLAVASLLGAWLGREIARVRIRGGRQMG